MALTRKNMPVPHHSARSGSVRLIVVHTTEGAQDIDSLWNWFKNPASQVSSHVGADNKRQGVIAEYVQRSRAAWAQGNYNGVSTCIELCTPAGAANGWSRSHWLNTQGWLLDSCAAWIAEEAAFYKLPLVRLSASQAQGSGRGVCGHVDIQPRDRTDPGQGFPWDVVLAKAAGGQPPTVQPPAEEADMTPAVAYWYNGASKTNEIHMAVVGSDGRVYYAGPPTGHKWHMVDTNSKAIGGLSIAVSGDGRKLIAYINGARNVCTYEQAPASTQWVWTNRGGNAK